MKRSARVEGFVTEVLETSDDGIAWELGFVMTPWREIGGAVRSAPTLRVDLVVGDEARLRPGRKLENRTVAVAVRELGPWKTRWAEGWAAKASKLPSVIRTRALRPAPPAKPAKVRDAKLGTFTVEDGRLAAWRRGYELFVLAPAKAKPDELLLRARAVVARVERALAILRSQVAAKILPSCNRWRAGAEEKAVTFATFTRALRLQSMEIGSRATSLMFECGDVLGDHGVEVRLAASGRITSAAIA